jgi:hypothetical protein
MMVSMAAAAVVAALMFFIISDTTRCAVSNLGWKEFPGDSGSTIHATPVSVPNSKCAFEVSFDLKKQGASVAAYQKVEQKLLAWWVKGIEFSYLSPGGPNSIEFKLFDKSDSGYSVLLGQIKDTAGDVFSQEVPYDSLRAINGGAIFHRKGFEVDRMDFTFVSSTPSDGKLTILDIRLVPIWQVWLIVLSPVLLLAILAGAYSLWHPETPEEAQPGDGKAKDKPRKKPKPAAPGPSKAKKPKK